MKKTILVLATTYMALTACSEKLPSSHSMSLNILSTGLIIDIPDDGAALIAKSDCIGCHKLDKKVIGPSYIDVANKYEATEKNIDLIASRIIKGSKGIWGPLPMSAHTTISKEDATTIVKYILSLKEKP